jgi:hypothetical protein
MRRLIVRRDSFSSLVMSLIVAVNLLISTREYHLDWWELQLRQQLAQLRHLAG